MPTGQIFGDTKTRTVTMDADLSDKEGYAVNLDTTDDNNVNLATAATAFPFPLIDCGNGSSSKYTGSIALSGRTIVKLGGTVAPGDKLTATTGSVWIKTTTDDEHYGAVALQVGVSGDEIEVSVERGTVSGAADD